MLLSWITKQNRLPMAPEMWGSTACRARSWGAVLGCGKVSERDPGAGALCAGFHQRRCCLEEETFVFICSMPLSSSDNRGFSCSCKLLYHDLALA